MLPLRSAPRWLLLVLLALSACAQPVQRRDWSAYSGPGAEAFRRPALPPLDAPDPLEPLNRSVSTVNHVFIVAVVDPIGWVYRFVVPRFARDRIRDLAANAVFPRNLVANLLQARWQGARDETARFAINTTVGLGGLFDPATELGFPAAAEDFGQVFARWGWDRSTFVMLPLEGPSSIRDAIGFAPDSLLDPASYFSPADFALEYNDLIDSIPDYRRYVASSADAYDDTRLLWSVAREAQSAAPDPSGPGPDPAEAQTPSAPFLAPGDPLFASHLDTGHVTLATSGRTLEYSYRIQPGRAPLVFVVPGLGAHRLANSSLALAEMAFARGFSVAIVSSTFSFEFIEDGASHALPGHAPDDSRDVYAALDAIRGDLGERFPERTSSYVYLGYSLGAFQGFYIAASEADPARSLHFERYLLIDPPVRLLYALKRLDAFYEVPLALPEPERAPEVHRILLKAVGLADRAQDERLAVGAYTRIAGNDLGADELMPAVERPFSSEEAEFLIGFSFRRALQAVLWASQEREDLGVLRTERSWLRRLPAYEEIADYSFEMYLFGFLLPYERDRVGEVASAEQLIAQNDLHSLAGELRGNPKLRVFANRNDFLTSDEDVAWLTSLVGPERVCVLPQGGRLGDLYRAEVQAELMAALEDLRGPRLSAR